MGAVPDKLFRIIRYLSSEGIFKLNGNNVSLTESGNFLRTDIEGTMKWCLIHWNEEASETFQKLYYEVTTGKEAFEEMFGTDLFEIYSKRPESQEAFTKCMKGLFFDMNKATAAEYNFAQHKQIMDFGGGMGSLTSVVLSGLYQY